MIDHFRSTFLRRMRYFSNRERKQRGAFLRRIGGFESLEDRRLLAISWVNAATNNFASVYGNENGALATQLVQRAIDDWNRVIADFNYDNDNDPQTDNTFSLTVTAAAAASPTERGGTVFTGSSFTTVAQGRLPNRPISATIEMDDNGGGGGWYFDPTPSDDAEFTGLVNSASNGQGTSYQASFINVATATLNYNDFYRTIVHEIGHAVGLYFISGHPLFALTSPVGFDQLTTIPNTLALRQFNGPNVTATFTTSGNAHIYEGPADPAFPNAPTHPNDLMNPGRALPAQLPPNPSGETTRQFISDLNAQILADAYGYTVVLPSSLDTAHATVDSQTGTLLVQGRTGALNDTITVDMVGTDIRVQVNATTELVPAAAVTQIVIAGNGGNDTITVAPELMPLRQDVHYVVSTNQDNATTGDLSAVIPGNQTSLRGAVIAANAAGAARGIYVPRGRYNLTLASATENSGTNDLDISGNVTIVGTGPGATVIDASALGAGAHNRVFEVLAGGALNLSRATVTGGNTGAANSGGGFLVSNAALALDKVSVVGNTGGSAGGIRAQNTSALTITNSVFTGNTTAGNAGAIHATGTTTVTIGTSLFANNSAATNPNLHLAVSGTTPVNLGSNRVDSTAGAGTFFNGDFVGAVDHVVTSIADSYNRVDDAYARSVRDAIDAANLTAGMSEVWLPAWNFVLSKVRINALNLVEIDISQGDIEIEHSLTARGIAGSTSVGWRSGAALDKVFELRGDYNGDGTADGTVGAEDYTIWRDTLGSTTDLRADGDDNGVIQQDDWYVWNTHNGNTLDLDGVLVT